MDNTNSLNAETDVCISRRRLLTYSTLTAGALAFPTLAQSGSDLQKQLNWLVKRQRREGRISRHERTAWSVYDFQTRKKLVSINENRRMQAASMVKVFVALAYFYLHQQAPRKYPYHAKQRRLMELMLVNSSNTATNTLMRLCKGPANVKRLCQLARKNRYAQLRIVEYIPAGGKTYRNYASARDYSRFLYDLWHNRLPSSHEIKRIMAIKNRDRIASAIMSPKPLIIDKTGSTSMLCGNMGIVKLSGSSQAYTFIGIIERSRRTKNYNHWIRSRGDAMRETSELVYRFMIRRYGLLKSMS